MTIPTTIIGAGNMGAALYSGLVAADKASDVWLCDDNPDKLEQAPNSRRLTDAAAVVTDCIVLVVKPQSFAALMETVEKRWEKKFIISVMAGVTIERIGKETGASSIVRAMPNLGARVGRSMTGWYATEDVSEEQVHHAEDIFSSIGKALRLGSESQIDGFTAVAGSGPAYAFLLAELLQAEAIKLGLSEEQSALVAREVLGASSRLLDEGEKSAKQWRESVTSKGGTTEAALGTLREGGFADIFHDAIAAAADRSRSLSKQ